MCSPEKICLILRGDFHCPSTSMGHVLGVPRQAWHVCRSHGKRSGPMWGTVREPHALLLLIFQICQGGGGGGRNTPWKSTGVTGGLPKSPRQRRPLGRCRKNSGSRGKSLDPSLEILYIEHQTTTRRRPRCRWRKQSRSCGKALCPSLQALNPEHQTTTQRRPRMR